MNKKHILVEIADCLIDLNFTETEAKVRKAVEEGMAAREILEKAVMKGLEAVGERYEKKEYFLSELLTSAEIAKHVMKILEPQLKTESKEFLAKIVLGTVQGDLHDIGKNLVGALLTASGFEVYDLGVDVKPEEFVNKIKEYKPELVGLSALLTVTLPALRETVRMIENAGLRKKVKIIVGGRAVSQEFANEIEVDAYCKDAWEGVKKAMALIGAS